MTRSKGWGITARSYGGLFYSKLMRFYDGQIFGLMQDQLKDSVLVDAGAGRCNLGFELLKATEGRALAFAIENNPGMIKRIKKYKKTNSVMFRNLEIITKDMYSGIISQIGMRFPYDILLFKRSLYGTDLQIKKVLQEAYEYLKPDGAIFIIHPEKDQKLFDDDGFGRIALDHWAKRQFNKLGSLVKNHQRKPMHREELEQLCHEALPNVPIEFLPNSRPAYNFLMIRK